jgi:translocation and assembly module TamA
MTVARSALLLFLCLPLAERALAQGNLEVQVTIEGLDRDISEDIRPLSALSRNPEGYSALAPIRRTANSDAQALVAALQSLGYYAATIQPSVTRDGAEVDVTFAIDPGEKFAIGGYEIQYDEEVATPRPEALEEAGIEVAGSPTGEELQRIEGELLNHLWDEGYLGAEIRNREVRADFEERTAKAVFKVHSGPQSRYGDVEVSGAERTDPDFIRQYRPFTEGEIASRDDLDDYRERLASTGLFSSVEVAPKLPEENGRTDILVRVGERPRRTIGGGLSYATDIGPGLTAFWENRNLLRRGETFRADLVASAPVQELSAGFRKDRPQLPGYYTLGVVLRNEDTDAFNAQTFEIGGSIAKLWLDDRLTTEGGLRYQYSDIRNRESEEDQDFRDVVTRSTAFSAVSVPLSVIWNSQDSVLDPQDGWLGGFNVTPFVGTTNFARIEATAVDRVFWGEDDGGTLAGRARIGAIYGANRSDIPPTERFFAGGGGSIRGYAFQEASPIDRVSGNILGGGSIAELNIEVRQHVTDSIELAAFTDMGGAFTANTPDFENILVGAGLGVRYHTPIGPIRVDFAIPLDRREFFVDDPEAEDGRRRVFQDDAFQFYIAIGQPF